jgi:hypothetical protein
MLLAILWRLLIIVIVDWLLERPFLVQQLYVAFIQLAHSYGSWSCDGGGKRLAGFENTDFLLSRMVV